MNPDILRTDVTLFMNNFYNRIMSHYKSNTIYLIRYEISFLSTIGSQISNLTIMGNSLFNFTSQLVLNDNDWDKPYFQIHISRQSLGIVNWFCEFNEHFDKKCFMFKIIKKILNTKTINFISKDEYDIFKQIDNWIEPIITYSINKILVSIYSIWETNHEILIQKNNDHESVHSEITNAILNIVNDTHETARNLGKDLYEKISDSYKKEAQESQNLISKVNQNVADFVAKFNSAQNQVIKEKEDFRFHELFQPANSEVSKNLIIDVLSLIKNKGFVVNKNLFMPENFDEQKSKLMLCEIAFIKNNRLFILDFKGTNYIFEYFASKAKNDKMAEENFNIKFKRYLMLLSNHRYYELISRAINSESAHQDSYKVVVVVPSKNEIRLLKDLQYYEKAQQLNFDIIDIEDINKIIS